ncbi:protein LATERAL ROOT PRIMORDIUM 1-like [Telopea speciosissima]|uniref:protein LATERAL ROOT PRIMORDIUM 1-like n=1 Tax=Telopea speciosissima TaxID=54955 RepID=UPI001CC71B51|nr:protein LATERAL ROOT PRIMORDIUM 1-like [Telopea speciosissima]
MGMVGLRDVFLVAPASSFHHNTQHQEPTIISDHYHHHHHHQISNSNAATALGVGVGVGVIPLLTTSPLLASSGNVGIDDDDNHNNINTRNSSSGSKIQLWQNQQSNFLRKPMLDHTNSVNFLNTGGCSGTGDATSSGGAVGIAGSSSSTTTCQDCGNQAKKDCNHRRCRTCCKSRGFDCATHVKSTWVPASRRRERQLSAAAVAAAAGSSGSTSGVKKPRLIASQTTTTSHTSTSNDTPPRSFDTSSSHQDASFRDALPGQIRAPAVFKCVRVTAIDDGDDEYAYQAVVKIGGHVFKGFLYDQGVEGRDGFPNLSELHLGGGGGGGGRNGGSSSSPIIDPSDVYAASAGGGLLGGTAYGNPIN